MHMPKHLRLPNHMKNPFRKQVTGLTDALDLHKWQFCWQTLKNFEGHIVDRVWVETLHLSEELVGVRDDFDWISEGDGCV